MDKLFQIFDSCFNTNDIISLQDLDSVKESDQNIKYKVESDTIISVKNLDIYNEKLIKIEPDNSYYLINIHNQE